MENTVKVIFKTMGLTLYFIVVGLFFILSTLSVLAPSAMIGFYDKLNLQSAKVYMYERVYARSEKIEDLYNVLEANIEIEDYEHIIKYINIMRNKGSYAEFCNLINERNTQNIDKNYYVYVCDYDSFLRSQYVNALYKTERLEKAHIIALEELANNSNVYAWEFGTYIDCIMTDETLDKTAKDKALVEIYNTELNGLSVQELINNNIDMIEDPESVNGFEKLKSLNQIIKIKTTNKYLAQAMKDDVLVQALVSDIEVLLDNYNKTLASI